MYCCKENKSCVECYGTCLALGFCTQGGKSCHVSWLLVMGVGRVCQGISWFLSSVWGNLFLLESFSFFLKKKKCLVTLALEQVGVVRGAKTSNSNVFLGGLVSDRMSYAYDLGWWGWRGSFISFLSLCFLFSTYISLSSLVKITLKCKGMNFCLDSAMLGNCMCFLVG